MLGSDARFSVRGEEVAAKVFDDEVVVVHLGTCTYYSASGSGADAWVWIEEGRPVAEVAAALAERYGIEVERARADLDRYVARLLEEGLITPANGGPATASEAAPPADRGEYAPPDLQAYRDMADLLALDPPLPELDRPAWRAAVDDGRG
ncbi:MAG TPA: PqqD family protein [Gemmatimonadota bacterium]|nr:PqqD family protein [Gemmatimonadota bacterium]